MNNLKIAIAQIKPIEGDLAYNFKKIISYIEKSEDDNVDLLVVSYGALTGLNMRLFLENKVFIKSVNEYNKLIKEKAKKTNILMHTINEDGEEVTVYINTTTRKENIYFPASVNLQLDSDDNIKKITINGVNISVNSSFPCEEINIISSPVIFAKEFYIEEIMLNMQDENQTNICVFPVGFANGRVFAGGSFGAYNREIFYREESFKENYNYIYMENKSSTKLAAKLTENEATYKALKMSVKEYINQCGFNGAVIEMSGDISSALVAAVAVDALGADKVKCLILPSNLSDSEDINNAIEVCQNIGAKYNIIPTTLFTEAFKCSMADIFKEEMKDTLQSGIKNVLNAAISNQSGDAVLITYNKSDLAVGNFADYTMGTLAVIMDLYIQDVYSLARYRNTLSPVIPESTIEREISNKLISNQIDLPPLYNYDELDKTIKDIITDSEEIPDIDEKTEAKIHNLILTSELKRSQLPMGIQVSMFSFDNNEFWDFPIMNRFRF